MMTFSEKRHLDGIRAPEPNKGLGSFINREDRSKGIRMNCRLVRFSPSYAVYARATKTIKKGTELVTVYSKGYRIAIV